MGPQGAEVDSRMSLTEQIGLGILIGIPAGLFIIGLWETLR